MSEIAEHLSAHKMTASPTDEQAIAFVHDLVEIPSVSGNERPCVEFFVQTAKSWGFDVSIDEAGNGIATKRSPRSESPTDTNAQAKELALLGHIDTVPGNIAVRIENGVLHGRGSVDAKGPLAAMLVAAARADIPGNSVVRVIAAVGEETTHSLGARCVAQSLQPHACIIGEPSGWDGVTLGYKGRLVMLAELEDASGHSAGPTASPADKILAFWMQCLQRVEHLNQGHSSAFDVIQATVRTLSTSSDGLRDRATLQAGFRLPRWMQPLQLESILRSVPDLSAASLTFEGHESAHVSDRNDLVVRAISNAIRSNGVRPHPKTKTGTADLNVVAPIWNCPIAAYGPGDSSLDHTPHERLPLNEYLNSIRVLKQAISNILDDLRRVETIAS